jgi:hypothetical protein
LLAHQHQDGKTLNAYSNSQLARKNWQDGKTLNACSNSQLARKNRVWSFASSLALVDAST